MLGAGSEGKRSDEQVGDRDIPSAVRPSGDEDWRGIGAEWVHQRLVERARAGQALRAEIAELACAALESEVFHALGFARARDYAVEALGVSAREFQEWAFVGRWARAHSELGAALRDGTLCWSKVRLLPKVLHPETVAWWIDLAKRLSVDALTREVRRIDESGLEKHGRGPRWQSRTGFACSRVAYLKWSRARLHASRQAGRPVGPAELVEAVTAETMAALGLEVERPEDAGPLEASTGTLGAEPVSRVRAATRLEPHELDARLRERVADERRREARLGRLLLAVVEDRVYRRLGYGSLTAYAREALGMSARKVQMLVRIERALLGCPALEAVYRSGALSCVKADLLVPLLRTDQDPGQRWARCWIERAGEVTFRRLREDVNGALLVLGTHPDGYRETGGLPRPEHVGVDSSLVAQMCALAERCEAERVEAEGAGGAVALPDEPCRVVIHGPRDLQSLFYAVLHTLQTRLEPVIGRLRRRRQPHHALRLAPPPSGAWRPGPHHRQGPGEAPLRDRSRALHERRSAGSVGLAWDRLGVPRGIRTRLRAS